MPRPDHDQETGIPDLTSLSLEELAELDDSVVANVIRVIAERRGGRGGYREAFSDFQSAT